MKRKICTLLAVLMILVCGNVGMAEEAENIETEMETVTDFRDTVWGMDQDEVKAIEGEPIDESDTALLYNGKAAGKNADILYNFQDNMLYEAAYLFNEEHTNPNLYYDDYKELIDIYTEKYGKPSVQKEDWNDDLYKDNPSKIGMAISIGHVTFISLWETDTSYIFVILGGDNFDIDLIAKYQDKNYEEKVNTDGI